MKILPNTFFTIAVIVFAMVLPGTGQEVKRDTLAAKNKQATIETKEYHGLQLPVLTEKQRDSITQKKQGLVIYNKTTNRPQYFDGSIWQNFTNDRYIGEKFGGGIVFFIDETGEHGLIAAPFDQSEGIVWGEFTQPVEVYDTEIGIGKYNTKKILNYSGGNQNAATICHDLQLNGYKDWFLPSKDELTMMYHNLKESGISVFAGNFYWTSSETDFGNAWVFDFVRGNESELSIRKQARVRAIRAF